MVIYDRYSIMVKSYRDSTMVISERSSPLFQIPNSRLGQLAKAATHEKILELCADYSLVDNE